MKYLINFLTLSLLFSLAAPCFGMEKNKQEGREQIKDEQPRKRENQKKELALLLQQLNEQFKHHIDETGFERAADDLINMLDSSDEQECIECLALVTPPLISRCLLPKALKLENTKIITLLLDYIKQLSAENASYEENPGDYIYLEELNYNFSASSEVEYLVEYAVQENKPSMIEFLTNYILKNELEVDLRFAIVWAHDNKRDDLFKKILQTKNGEESLVMFIQEYSTFSCFSESPFKNFFPTNDSWISFLCKAYDYLSQEGKFSMLFSICASGNATEIKKLMKNERICQCLKNNIDELFPLTVNDIQKVRVIWEIKKPNNFDRVVYGAVLHNNFEVLQFLVNQGVDLDVSYTRKVGRVKRTIVDYPLLVALQNNNEEMILFLLNNGVTQNIDLLLLGAIRVNKTNIIKCICSNPKLYTQLKMSIALKGQEGKELILQAMVSVISTMFDLEDAEGVFNFVQHIGAFDFMNPQDINTEYNWSCYPFILNSMHVCKFLIRELGINSNLRFIVFPNEELNKEALQAGINATKRILQDNGVPQEVIKEALEKADSSLNQLVKLSSVLNSATLLMIAAYHGNAELVKLLLDHGADRELINKNGLTALDIAKDCGHEEIVKLLDIGEDCSKGYQPWSPLQFKTAKVAIEKLKSCTSKSEVQEYFKGLPSNIKEKVLFLCSSLLKEQLENLPEIVKENETNEDEHTNL